MPTNLLDAFQHLHKAKFTHATIELCGIGVWINDMFEDSGWESWQGPLDCTSVTTDDIDLAEIHATTPVRSFEHYFYIRGISEDSIDRQIYGLLPWRNRFVFRRVISLKNRSLRSGFSPLFVSFQPSAHFLLNCSSQLYNNKSCFSIILEFTYHPRTRNDL
jgi:hypothetical protein